MISESSSDTESNILSFKRDQRDEIEDDGDSQKTGKQHDFVFLFLLEPAIFISFPVFHPIFPLPNSSIQFPPSSQFQ